MITLKSLILLVCFVGIVGFGPPQGECSQHVPQQVLQAAEEGLPSFLESIPQSDLEHFNFNSADELQQATLGAPIEIYTIHPDDILDFNGQTPVADLVSPTGMWLVPVVANGKIRTFLTVDTVDGAWKAISIGSSQLAEEWSNIADAYPQEGDYGKIFVRIYQATSDLILVNLPQGGNAFIALRSAGIALGLEGGELYSPAKVLLDMKDTVRQSLEQNQAYE